MTGASLVCGARSSCSSTSTFGNRSVPESAFYIWPPYSYPSYLPYRSCGLENARRLATTRGPAHCGGMASLSKPWNGPGLLLSRYVRTVESLIPRYSSYLACSVVSEPEKQVLLAGVRERRRPASGCFFFGRERHAIRLLRLGCGPKQTCNHP